MFAGIAETLKGEPLEGEWYLTDAFQYMIDHGKQLVTAEVQGWHDCGKVETVLATNRHLLESGRGRPPAGRDGVTVTAPVHVADGVTLERCSIGPNVSLDPGTTVVGSTLRDVVVGRNAVVRDSSVTHSLIGDETRIEGKTLENMVAAKDEIGDAP